MRDGDVYVLARGNLLSLAQNSFVGRGIVAGMDSAGKNFVQIYWVSADDENKRNLAFSAEDDTRLKAFPFDTNRVANHKSACYDVMAERNRLYVVSSGDQTETILTHHRADLDFYKAMLTRTYEYDGPNFTPRISSIFSLEGDVYFTEMSVLRKSPIRESCERIFYRFEQFLPGLGYYINTYSFYWGIGQPLPSFCGEPYLLPLEGDIDKVLETFWDALDKENRVSIAVKFISLETYRSTIRFKNEYVIAG